MYSGKKRARILNVRNYIARDRFVWSFFSLNWVHKAKSTMKLTTSKRASAYFCSPIELIWYKVDWKKTHSVIVDETSSDLMPLKQLNPLNKATKKWRKNTDSQFRETRCTRIDRYEGEVKKLNMKPAVKRSVDYLLTAFIGNMAHLTGFKAEESGAVFCMQIFIRLSIFGSSGKRRTIVNQKCSIHQSFFSDFACCRAVAVLYNTYVWGVIAVRKLEVAGPKTSIGQIFKMFQTRENILNF